MTSTARRVVQPLDKWLKMDENGTTHQANTFKHGRSFLVSWHHVDEGQVTSVRFDTYEDARSWLERLGFNDFSKAPLPGRGLK